MSEDTRNGTDRFELARSQLLRVREALAGVIVGQDLLIDGVITALFAGGHVLLEGLPGLGKTHLAKGIARCIGLDLQRIQCTPDLMPADVTGSEVLADPGGAQRFEFLPGPLFANMVLVDEINRATPKTQAAMLEAMQEGQVTVLGNCRPLPQPFWVLATQNPIELEGTYPLPEAQLDRFLFKLRIAMPAPESLLSMLDVSLDEEPAAAVEPVLQLPQVTSIMATAREVMVAAPLKQAAVELVMATHAGAEGQTHEHFRYGASPRGLQSLVRAARVRALLAGRTHVAIEDLAEVALPALRHRVLLTIDNEVHGVDVDRVLAEQVEQWLQRQ